MFVVRLKDVNVGGHQIWGKNHPDLDPQEYDTDYVFDESTRLDSVCEFLGTSFQAVIDNHTDKYGQGSAQDIQAGFGLMLSYPPNISGPRFYPNFLADYNHKPWHISEPQSYPEFLGNSRFVVTNLWTFTQFIIIGYNRSIEEFFVGNLNSFAIAKEWQAKYLISLTCEFHSLYSEEQFSLHELEQLYYNGMEAEHTFEDMCDEDGNFEEKSLGWLNSEENIIEYLRFNSELNK